MPRSKNAVASRARRKRILKQAKGFYGKRKNVYTVAKNIVEKGMTYSYVGRKLKKREYRRLWIARVDLIHLAQGIIYWEAIELRNGVVLDQMHSPFQIAALALRRHPSSSRSSRAT